MNTYHAFYKGAQLEVEAGGTYAAKKKAAELFKAKSEYAVAVVLVAKDGEQIVHTADF